MLADESDIHYVIHLFFKVKFQNVKYKKNSNKKMFKHRQVSFRNLMITLIIRINHMHKNYYGYCCNKVKSFHFIVINFSFWWMKWYQKFLKIKKKSQI